MDYYFITGTSRGIGKALAEKLLAKPNNQVCGISRGNSIEHERYTHFTLDLSVIEKVQDFSFPDVSVSDKIVLVNNSGSLGHVNQVGNLNTEQTVSAFNLNIVSVALLTNQFLKQFQDLDCERIILNTSSGAGKFTITSWSTYCSTKAALDMYAMVIHDEQLQHFPSNPVRIHSIAPGIVDTQMQDEIRMIPSSEFAEVDRFHVYKNENQLVSAQSVAEGYISIIDNPEKFTDVLLDLREI